MKKILALAFIALFWSVAAHATLVTLQNPGFETSWTGGTTVSGWVRSSTSTYFTTTRNTTTKYAGLASIALARTSATSYYIYQEVAGAAGTRYTYSARVYDNANGKVRLYVNFYNGTTLLSGARYSGYTVNSTSWQLLSLTVTNPASTTKVRIEVRSYDDPTAYRGTQYIDDVKLDQLTTTVDITKPTVSLTSPAASAKVGGSTTVTATASDNVGVTSVKFYKNQTLIATDTASPYSAVFNWNADGANSNYTVTAVASDVMGNTNASTVAVNKPGNTLAGPGSTITSGGVFFQVWAPHATSATVTGDFNAWNNTANVLSKTADGWWYGFVPGAAAEQKYKYVFNGTLMKPDPYSRMMEHSAGASIVKNTSYAWTDGAWVTPAFEDMIIYELHVGTYSGKNDGQGLPAQGNFNKLLTKLDYIKGLGANTIELLPVNEVPGDFYLGYSSVSFFSIEHSYGSATGKAYDELKAVINACHAKGLAVIMDIVPNHVSTISGQDNFLWNYDGDTEYNDGGIYYNGQNTEWGPAPDWGRAEVKRYIEDANRYFISELHCDGMRWDATSRIADKPNGWDTMRNMIWNLRTSYPGKIFIAEELPYSKATVEAGNFNSGWYVEFHHSMEKALGGSQTSGSTPEVAIAGGDWTAVYKRTVYSIGHDECRNGGAYNADAFGGRDNWDSRAKNRLIGALQFFVPGIPMMFQGEEFLQNGWFNDQPDNAVNWTFQTDGVGSQMQTMYKAATATRWANDAFRRGSFAWAHNRDANNVLAFRRNWGANACLVIVNLSGVDYVNNHSYGITTGQTGQWTQAFNSQEAAYGGWDGSGNAFYEPWTQGDGKIYVNVPKYSVVVMKIK